MEVAESKGDHEGVEAGEDAGSKEYRGVTRQSERAKSATSWKMQSTPKLQRMMEVSKPEIAREADEG